MENKFNEMIVLLQAYLNACKDFHYFCTSYALHLLADEIMGEDLYDTIDAIKENIFIAEGMKPLKAKEYAEKVAKETPEIKATDKENLIQLYEMAQKIEGLANSVKPDRRAGNVLLDGIAETMAHVRTLLNIELENFNKIAEDYKKEECEGCEEKPIDRKVYKIADVDGDKVAKTVLDYEAKNLLVAEDEESTLDKLSKKLGVE